MTGKVYGLTNSTGDYVGKCACCNFWVGHLYYSNPKEAKQDVERITRDERPLHGLCAECFLSAYAEITAIEVDE